jgi:4-amino-4-deoxy-L-arabinose transferase-like glycosyltransferase
MLLVILLVGAALRLWHIGSQPLGLYRDEAFYGLDALNVGNGEFQLYFSANNGREPLFIYLVALSIKIFGNTPLAVRFPSALVGIALIPATYALGRALLNRRMGLLAAGLVAFTFWPVALSRIGFRVGTLPLVTALSLACAAAGWRARRPKLVALGGAFYGMSFYTYLAARFTPAALIAFGIFWYIAHRSTFPAPRRWAAFFAPAVLVAAPLGLLALAQPDILFGRVEQVSIFSPDVHHGDFAGTLFHNLSATLGMFVWRGDALARHNLPGRPVFDLLMGLAFTAGVALALWRAARRRDRASALILLWTAVMLLPTLLATDAPHFLRAAGVLPMAMFFPALALEAVWTRIPRGRALSVAGLALSLLFTTRDYFGRYLGQPETRYAFESAAADLSAQAKALLSDGSQRQVYLDKRLWDSFASIRFLLAGQSALQVFDPAAPPPIDANAETRLIVWPHADPQAALTGRPNAMMVRAEAGPLYRGDEEAAPYSLFTTYTLTPAPAEWPAPLAVFERGVILQSIVITPTASGLSVVLLWRAQAGVWQTGGPAYHVLVQWRAKAEAVLAQDDAPPAQALFPTPWWRGGEAVWDSHELTLASTEPPPESELIIGMYDYPSLTRLPLLTGPGDFVVAPVP